jgi:hypothetical protein
VESGPDHAYLADRKCQEGLLDRFSPELREDRESRAGRASLVRPECQAVP